MDESRSNSGPGSTDRYYNFETKKKYPSNSSLRYVYLAALFSCLVFCAIVLVATFATLIALTIVAYVNRGDASPKYDEGYTYIYDANADAPVYYKTDLCFYSSDTFSKIYEDGSGVTFEDASCTHPIANFTLMECEGCDWKTTKTPSISNYNMRLYSTSKCENFFMIYSFEANKCATTTKGASEISSTHKLEGRYLVVREWLSSQTCEGNPQEQREYIRFECQYSNYEDAFYRVAFS